MRSDSKEKSDENLKSYSNFFLNILFLSFVLALLYNHICIFFDFNLKNIDTDQMYMWNGARDFANGNFYEPRYYGQDYNTYMEALFAVPFMLIGFPVYYSVPFATHFIFIFPYLFSSLYLFYKNKKVEALIFLSLIMCLPSEFDVLTSLPRGFVTGLFFCSLYIISILNPNNLLFIGINTFLTILGYFVNPNIILVSAPLMFFLFISNFRNPKFYYSIIPGLLMFILFDFFFNHFYKIHPDYIYHRMELRYSTTFFMESLSHLDDRFAYISPFFSNNSIFLLAILILMTVYFFFIEKNSAFSFILFFSVLLFSFCFGKTSDAVPWVYMSYCRMFLAIPFFISLFSVRIQMNIKPSYLFAFLIPLIFCFYKTETASDKLQPQYNEKIWAGVRILSIQDIIHFNCDYKNKCKEQNVGFFLVSSRFWLFNVLSCGGQALYKDYPETMETIGEKRYWVRKKYFDSIVDRFLLISSCQTLEKIIPKTGKFSITPLDGWGLYLIEKNKLPMREMKDWITAYEKISER